MGERHENGQFQQLFPVGNLERPAGGYPQSLCQEIVNSVLGDIVICVQRDNRQTVCYRLMDQSTGFVSCGYSFKRFENQGVMGKKQLAGVLDCGIYSFGAGVKGHHDPINLVCRVPDLQPDIIPIFRQSRRGYFINDSNYV